MIGADFGRVSGEISIAALAAVYIAGLVFGIGFNWMTDKATRSGFIRGYTALFVVVGVLITLALAAVVIGLLPALVVVGEFVFTGAPMILGEMVRHKREELALLRRERQEAKHGNTTEEVAD
jgi:apolipoprotein N-acyltransferase